MKRALLAVVVAGLCTTGCASKADVTTLETRVAALETRVTKVETDHAATRDKLQKLLVWVNHRAPPDVGLYDWMGAVQDKLWPANGPGDPQRPGSPPPPF